MIWTIQKLLTWAIDYFSQKKISTARLDAELLLSYVLQLERIQLYTQFDRPLNKDELQNFKTLLKRRVNREPLAYILGEKEFYSLKFKVTPDVLIPRPETELIVEKSLDVLREPPSPLGGEGRGEGEFEESPTLKESNLRILDLATGSGCILITLLKHLPKALGIGIDISAAALKIAAENAQRHKVAERVQWIEQDLSLGISNLEPFDLITANLPYVSEQEYKTLEPELTDYEPKAALVPGTQGTEAIEWVLPFLANLLKPRGLALFEMGYSQKVLIQKLLKRACPKLKAEVIRDLADRDRVLVLNKI